MKIRNSGPRLKQNGNELGCKGMCQLMYFFGRFVALVQFAEGLELGMEVPKFFVHGRPAQRRNNSHWGWWPDVTPLPTDCRTCACLKPFGYLPRARGSGQCLPPPFLGRVFLAPYAVIRLPFPLMGFSVSKPVRLYSTFVERFCTSSPPMSNDPQGLRGVWRSGGEGCTVLATGASNLHPHISARWKCIVTRQ